MREVRSGAIVARLSPTIQLTDQGRVEMSTEVNSNQSEVARRVALTAALLLLVGLSFVIATAGKSTRPDDAANWRGQASWGGAVPLPTFTPRVHVSNDDPSRLEFESREAMSAAGVSTVLVEQRSIVECIEAPGHVTYDQRVMSRLSSRASGTVWSVEKRLGDIVSKGDVLAVVEAIEIGKLKAEFLDRLALCEAKAETLKRLEQASAAIPAARIRDAQLNLRESRIHLLTAEQTLCNLGIPLRMKEFEALSDTERATRIQFLGIPQQITSRLDPEIATNNLVPVIAPIDGVVINHEAGEGEWADPSKPLFEIADLRRMWIRLEVSRDRAADIRLGQKIEFQGDGTSTTVHCQVSWISTEINKSDRVLEVRAEFENPRLDMGQDTPVQHRLLRANVGGVGRICVRNCPRAVAVPCQCLHRDAQGAVVFVQDSETTFTAVRVERGACDGEYVEICGPVAPGASVVCNGVELLAVASRNSAAAATAKSKTEQETVRSEPRREGSSTTDLLDDFGS